VSTYKPLHDLLAEARVLVSFLETDSVAGGSMDEVIDRYLDFKSISARAMRELTDAVLEREDWALDGVIQRLEAELRSQLAGVVPLDIVVLKRYGHTHRKLYEYLWQHRGRSVTAARLRVLTGDQVHTERRVRELRDIGLRIDAVRRSGQNVYELTDDTFDLEIAIRRFLPDFVEAVEGWTQAQRNSVLERFAGASP
jgi:hypothetical protein